MSASRPRSAESTTERRHRKQADRARVRRRRTVMIVAAVLTTLVVISAAVLIPAAIRRSRVVVAMETARDTAPGAAAAIVAAGLEEGGSLRVDGRTLEVRVVEQANSPDVRLAAAGPLVARESLGAADPYVAVVDQGAGVNVDSRAPLPALVGELTRVNGDERVPLVVAGDVRSHFAAFIVYLSAELLPPTVFAELLAHLAPVPIEPTPDEVSAWIERLGPVIDWIAARRSDGLLAVNWTNWDEIALRSAMLAGDGAVYFVPRSYLKSLGQQERFSLTMARLPAGEGRLTYRLVGQSVALLPGTGPRSDATIAAIARSRLGALQERIERETGWSPVALEGDAMNAEHRDAVRWLANAEAFHSLDPATAARPLMIELHRVLR